MCCGDLLVCTELILVRVCECVFVERKGVASRDTEADRKR